jgi:hypothetical protein
MNCHFDLCEFINVFIGGIFTGILASFLFVCLTNFIENRKDSRKFKYLKSKDNNSFDWICYSMTKENGRIRENNPNGSSASIEYKKGKVLNFRLKEQNNRIWNAKVTMTSEYVGSLAFRYEKEQEYGFKDVFIGEEIENGIKYDTVFLVGKGKDYNNEILMRESKK